MSNSFGDFLKKQRESKGMTINQLAMYSDISSSQLSRIESGKRGIPKPDTIKKIADALKISYEDLMIAAGYISNQMMLDFENGSQRYMTMEESESYRIKLFEREKERNKNDISRILDSGESVYFEDRMLSREQIDMLKKFIDAIL